MTVDALAVPMGDFLAYLLGEIVIDLPICMDVVSMLPLPCLMIQSCAESDLAWVVGWLVPFEETRYLCRTVSEFPHNNANSCQ